MLIPQVFRVSATHTRIFGLDLMRAFAIMAVVIGHGHVYISPKFKFFTRHVLRFDGVGIFFVLSGFLIGGILIRTLESRPATFATLWDFWLKRWIRTVPPYFLALLIALAFAIGSSSPTVSSSPNEALQSVAPYFLFIQNLNWPHPYFYQEGWSLAVEEWFYLLSAPSIFLLTAWKFRPRTAVLVTAVTIILLTTLHRYYSFATIPPQTINEWDDHFRKIVLQRLDTLMYGVLAAYWAYYHPYSWSQGKLLKFALGFVGMYLLGDGDFVNNTMLTSFGCVFSFSCSALATAFILPLLSNWRTSRSVAASAITHVSLISYSMYLLHHSIINYTLVLPFIQKSPFSQPIGAFIGMGLYLGLTLLASTLMYKYFEVPVMGLRNKLKKHEPEKAEKVDA